MRHTSCIRALRLPPLCRAAQRAFTQSSILPRAFEGRSRTEGDAVILRDRRDASHDGMLVRLQSSKTANTHRGVFKHSDIIGKHPRQVVQSSKGTSFRVHEPTLAEYVRLTPRIVTPIYPSDTNLIVSLLDIHVDAPSSDATAGPPLEILEAGTGHGALTLHLARAVHAANPPRPKTSPIARVQEPEDAVYLGETMSELEEPGMDLWKKSRGAIVHTLDISSKHSKHARKIVEGFRHGMYAGNIDWHVGDISAWIAAQTVTRKTEEPFLSHVFLDLPNANHHLANVAPALRVNGMLAVFNPSITQIAECVETIREHKMPYLLDQVIELGAGSIREWDVRSVRPRATLRTAGTQEPEVSADEGSVNAAQGLPARDDELAEDLTKKDKWAMVCRPKAGQQVVGGGFLGLWRRMEKPQSSD